MPTLQTSIIDRQVSNLFIFPIHGYGCHQTGNRVPSLKHEQRMPLDDTDAPTTRLCNEIVLISQAAIGLQQQTQKLPSLFAQLITISDGNSARQSTLTKVTNWLAKTLQKLEKIAWQRTYFQQSITDLAERETQLSNWALEHGLRQHEFLLQLFLEIGLERNDLKTLEEAVCEIRDFPELLSFLELMLAIQITFDHICLDLQNLALLTETIAVNSTTS